MRKELGTPGAVVGAFALVLLFGGLTLAIYPGWDKIGAWASKSDAPAWVQAVGSVVAILASGAIAWWQLIATRNFQRETSRQRAIVMVETIGALSRAHLGELESFSAMVDRHNYLATLDYMERLDARALFLTAEQAAQSIPLHELPDAETVRLLIDLQNAIRTNRDAASKLRDHIMAGEGDWAPILFPLGPNIEGLRLLLDKNSAALKRAEAL
ncbi:hypothetical protein JVX96_24550 [Variovorax sp. PDNC026]|uniref:hypothetical protein n=1 Tax=Variovorax sp. PDNC026 TaxID=2811425 RepID=UPI001964947B|nr:hypothetical protein [Variovorax sp. PDNC026]QRY31214.1 hypothetical protein JVX96_24550 [Variovorax sp. PDNC026]